MNEHDLEVLVSRLDQIIADAPQEVVLALAREIGRNDLLRLQAFIKGQHAEFSRTVWDALPELDRCAARMGVICDLFLALVRSV